MSKAIAGKTKHPRAHAKGTGTAWVYKCLRGDILSLAIEPGEDLDEAGLVERFGLSRTPVREALIRLAADSLVELLPNRGAKVASIDLREFPRYVEALDLIQRAATRLAASRRTEADLARIAELRDRFEQAVSDADAAAMTESNRGFHVAIGVASGNRYLSDGYARLLDQGMRMLRIPFAYDPQGDNGVDRHLAKIIKEHRAITKAIRDGNVERAEALAQGHTELFQSRLLQYLQQIDTREVRISSTDGGKRLTMAAGLGTASTSRHPSRGGLHFLL